LPKSQRSKAKRALQEIWMAEAKKGCARGVRRLRDLGAKYDKAVECLIKDHDAPLAFYDFPAEHWKHLRTMDEMDKRFFHDRDDDCGNRYVHSFVRPRRGSFFRPGHRSAAAAQGRSRLAAFAATARLGLDWPEHGGTLAWNGIAFLVWLELAVSGDYGRGARTTSWRSVTRRPQPSPDCLFVLPS
jgi:hypothetical protein